jgi:hypothetical protein
MILQPGDEPDEDLAAVIENPGAWEEDEEPDPDHGAEPQPEAEPEDEPEVARPPRRGTRKTPQ